MPWVIEDRSAAETPDWARAGVIVTDDVAAYDRAELRLLNGAHSSLAYLGLLAAMPPWRRQCAMRLWHG